MTNLLMQPDEGLLKVLLNCLLGGPLLLEPLPFNLGFLHLAYFRFAAFPVTSKQTKTQSRHYHAIMRIGAYKLARGSTRLLAIKNEFAQTVRERAHRLGASKFPILQISKRRHARGFSQLILTARDLNHNATLIQFYLCEKSIKIK